MNRRKQEVERLDLEWKLTRAQGELVASTLDDRVLFFAEPDQHPTGDVAPKTEGLLTTKETSTPFRVQIILGDFNHLLLEKTHERNTARPPFNAEYIFYVLLQKEERKVIIGDLIEEYVQILERFNKQRADLWFYKQVLGSVLPLLHRTLLRIGALVWLGRILRRLIS